VAPGKAEIEKTVAEVLEGSGIQLKVDSSDMHEDLEKGSVQICCEVHDTHTGEKKTIEGRGVGIIDALMNGLVSLYFDQYLSLKTIRFAGFSIKANLDSGEDSIGSDSTAEITLLVTNSQGVKFPFVHTSPSITRSSIQVVLDAIGFFINAERAFITIRKALNYAQEQHRQDSVDIYTQKLMILVEATSYSGVLEKIEKTERAQ